MAATSRRRLFGLLGATALASVLPKPALAAIQGPIGGSMADAFEFETTATHYSGYFVNGFADYIPAIRHLHVHYDRRFFVGRDAVEFAFSDIKVESW